MSNPSTMTFLGKKHHSNSFNPWFLVVFFEKLPTFFVVGLKKKLVLLEEFNSDLVKLKTTAEDEAIQLDQQLMRSRMENKKLQDPQQTHKKPPGSRNRDMEPIIYRTENVDVSMLYIV